MNYRKKERVSYNPVPQRPLSTSRNKTCWDDSAPFHADPGSSLPGRISTGMYMSGLRPQNCTAEERRKLLTCRYLAASAKEGDA